MNGTAKNIIVFFLAVIVLGITIYVIKQRDTRIVNLWERNKYTTDSIYASPAERTTAQQFADTILPALKQKGLIISIEQNQMHTIIIVSGKLWKERSPFFKENFLTHVMIYNKVNGFSESVTIIDEHNRKVYAKIVPPGRKEVYK